MNEYRRSRPTSDFFFFTLYQGVAHIVYQHKKASPKESSKLEFFDINVTYGKDRIVVPVPLFYDKSYNLAFLAGILVT